MNPVSRLNVLRQQVGSFVEKPAFTKTVTAVIVLNAVTLGLETSDRVMESVGSLLHFIDQAVLVIFFFELLAKLFAYGGRFFKSGWNIFDFVIVGIALAPSSGNLSVLRALRILRGLRLVTVVPSMRRVVAALIAAIPGISSVVALLALVYYVFGVMVTQLYGDTFPDWFGTVGKSMFSLFQIMTLESWSMGIVRPVMEIYPYAWVVFVLFIMMTSFAVINLFIAVIVNAMTEQHHSQSEDIHKVSQTETHILVKQMENLQQQLDEIKVILKRRQGD